MDLVASVVTAAGGLVALRGLAPGRASRPAAPRDILSAAAHADADPRPMYVDVDAEGFLVPAGARGLARGAGAAALLARALLAPGGGGEGGGGAALLEPCGGGWRLRVRAPAAPHAALPLWPRRDLLARAAFPALAPQHNIGEGEYACDRCGARLGSGHALRLHLFVSCAPAGALPFYSTLLRRLAEPRPCTSGGALEPAALEALATAWGRGAGGAAGHACVYCGRLYSRRYGLKIHLRTHTGYKPLRCPHCRRAFGDPSNLNKHVKLHAGGGAGPHGCALCGKALGRRRDLERHVRARH